MHVELVTTPAGRETVEINFGGRIESLSCDDARKLAKWINELLPIYKCDDCGKTDIRPLDNGDGKTRCEDCAVKYYREFRNVYTQDFDDTSDETQD